MGKFIVIKPDHIICNGSRVSEKLEDLPEKLAINADCINEIRVYGNKVNFITEWFDLEQEWIDIYDRESESYPNCRERFWINQAPRAEVVYVETFENYDKANSRFAALLMELSA